MVLLSARAQTWGTMLSFRSVLWLMAGVGRYQRTAASDRVVEASCVRGACMEEGVIARIMLNHVYGHGVVTQRAQACCFGVPAN
jgi:hypothetical protein